MNTAFLSERDIAYSKSAHNIASRTPERKGYRKHRKHPLPQTYALPESRAWQTYAHEKKSVRKKTLFLY